MTDWRRTTGDAEVSESKATMGDEKPEECINKHYDDEEAEKQQ